MVITGPHRAAGRSDESYPIGMPLITSLWSLVCVYVCVCNYVSNSNCLAYHCISTVNTLSVGIKAVVVEWQLKPDCGGHM